MLANSGRVLVEITRQHHSGTIKAADLPPECRRTARRQLSAMESLERDAVVQALTQHGGVRRAAATHLGISRATIYRKIKDYGIIAASR